MTPPGGVFEPDQPSGWTSPDFQRFVVRQRWIFARTMPENPHEYALRREAGVTGFDEAVRFIREHGEIEHFRGTPYKVLVEGGYKYWTMGAPLDETVLINRKREADRTQSGLAQRPEAATTRG